MSIPRTGLALVCLLLFAGPSLRAAAPEIRQFPSGQPVSPQQLPEAICRGWVELRTASRSQVVFWDILLDVDEGSRLLLGCNQDYIYALTLAGGFDNGVQRLTEGMASLWPHFGGAGDSPSIHDFSAGTLLKLFAAEGQPGDAGLEKLARIQQVLTGADAGPEQAERPGAGALIPCAGTAPYRVFPEIMAIKRASRHWEDYGLRTASQFAGALAQRDTGLLAALLSPSLFEEESSAANPAAAIRPSPSRNAFAERLVTLNDFSPATQGNPPLRNLGNLQYEMRTNRQAFRITLHDHAGCLYVKRLDPQP